MAEIEWSALEDRRFFAGLDRGVLYVEGQAAVPWNGLISVEEDRADRTVESKFFDGKKFVNIPTRGSFKAIVRAFTYPDEFEACQGIGQLGGVSFDNQLPAQFAMSYRTLVGNAIDGDEHAYRVHMLFGLTASPENLTHRTLSNNVDIAQLGWRIDGLPISVPGFFPTSHMYVDTRMASASDVESIEDILYGRGSEAPRMPTVDEMVDLYGVTVTDNGDGTFTVDGPASYVTSDGTTFSVVNANAVFLDENTYQISSSGD